MRIKASDYIMLLLKEHNISQAFVVVGGGAMHLDDSIGHCDGINVVFNHHEQACAMAAESYARVNNQMAVVCVTSGPGGTNALTGVLCAWNDSIPLLVLSGQVRTDTTIQSTGLKLRQFGEQEYDIIHSVSNMTKYAEMLTDASQLRYCVEKAIYMANHGRKGPCWLDIPLDIQGMMIETEEQTAYIPEESEDIIYDEELKVVNQAIRMLASAKRPLIIAGTGIRSAGVQDAFYKLVEELHIPVVAAIGVPDLYPTDAEDYFGTFGVVGGRTGNFLVQNADCILVLGSRLSFKQIGFNYEAFSRNSYKIMVDADELELQKKTICIDLPIKMNLEKFFSIMENITLQKPSTITDWLNYCRELKLHFSNYNECYEDCDKVNPYYFAKRLKELVAEDAVIVLGNSCVCDMERQTGIAKLGQRMWGNTNCGTMGYDLPAAIGASLAVNGTVYCVTGDGSIMMNLQELQTVVHYQLPIKIFIHNNEGYEAIYNTNNNYFGRLTGCTKESGISFPDFSKLAQAFGISYCLCRDHKELENVLPEFLAAEGYGICEIWSDRTQQIEPKSKGKEIGNGKMYSPPIDDLYPFLDKEEYEYYSNVENFIREGKA